MNTWDKLINKLQVLNEVARNIQTFIEEDGTNYPHVWPKDDEISEFVNDYLNWYSECLNLLPEDLKDKFRAAYENSVKQFLIAPKAQDADEIYYEGEYTGISEPYFKYDYKTYFYQPSFTHRQLLLEASKRLPIITTSQVSFDAVEIIERLARRFDLVAQQLKRRHDNRGTLTISDEYDVQDLFQAMLKLFFDDVRPEEYTPSHAGRSSRIDFLLKQEAIVIEIKKTRGSLRAKGIAEELIIDKETYRHHPNCKTLIAFVYDPDKYIDNPRGLEVDLSGSNDGMTVKVLINQSHI